MNIGAYMYLIRGEEYKFPYRECVRSLLDFCDGVHVLVDPRFQDSEQVIKNLEIISIKVHMHVEKIELENPGVDGITKARARELASQGGYNWLIQMDADEVFRPEDISKIEPLLSRADDDIISCGQINWFNGNHIKFDSPISKERFSRNVPYITHGIPVQYRTEREDGYYYVSTEPKEDGPDSDHTDGAGYIDKGGNPLIGGQSTINDKNKIFLTQKRGIYATKEYYDSLHDDIWVMHYSWSALSLRWLREPTWDYFWGILRGKYQSLDDYETADGKNRDFFAQNKLKQPKSDYDAITGEMQNRSIFRVDWLNHPQIMDGWREMANRYIYGEKKHKLHKPGFSLRSMFKKGKVVFE